MTITFNELPEAVGQLFKKLENIERLLCEKNNALPLVDEMFAIQEAAKFICLSVPTVYGLVSRSEIPSMKKGKRLYFSKSELLEWIKTGKKKTVAETEIEADAYLSSIQMKGRAKNAR